MENDTSVEVFPETGHMQIPFHPDPPFRSKLTPRSGDTDPFDGNL